ncbi:hypothetical protein ASD11_14930 [Aeromicrobium sp. Root495]|nr:hypothetical protein ASD11_14930 [Aeromicrobium sp. Root495]
MAELALSGLTISMRNIVYRMLFVYTDAQMAHLGPDFTRDAERIATMRSAAQADPETGLVPTGVDPDVYRLWCSEYERARLKFHRLLEALDDTPLPADRCWTADEINAGAKKVDPAKTRLRKAVANGLVHGSIRYKNEQFFPALGPDRALDGVLRDSNGDLATDQTNADVCLPAYQDVKHSGERKASANQMARGTTKSRRSDFMAAVGLNMVLAASALNGRRVPNIVLGMALSTPSPAHKDATLTSIDAVAEG